MVNFFLFIIIIWNIIVKSISILLFVFCITCFMFQTVLNLKTFYIHCRIFYIHCRIMCVYLLGGQKIFCDCLLRPVLANLYFRLFAYWFSVSFISLMVRMVVKVFCFYCVASEVFHGKTPQLTHLSQALAYCFPVQILSRLECPLFQFIWKIPCICFYEI